MGATETGSILIRGARQLLTLRGPHGARRGAALAELGIISDGALLVRDGSILEVGPSRRLENLAAARNAVEINAAGRVVMPGFVDSHTHLVFPHPVNSAADLAGEVRAVNTGTAKRLAARSRTCLHSMARHGTTTVEAKTGCGPDGRAEVKLLRILAALKRDPVDVVPTLLMRLTDDTAESGYANDVLDWYIRELLPKVHQRRLARFADLAWESDCGLGRHFAEYLKVARGLGFGCKIHADHPRPAPAITLALEHFAASIDHLDHATRAEAEMMRGSHSMATLLPCPSFYRRSTGAPARALIEAGVPVALASDFNPKHTPNLNMQTVVALACLQMDLTPAEAISAATVNGAHALGCADRVGTLEVGKAADLLILNISDYRDMAVHFGTNLVHLTMKRGEFIYEEGEVARIPVEELRPSW